MNYKIEVFEDGDIYVTKLEKRLLFDSSLHLKTLNKLRSELENYGVNQVNEDIQRITCAEINEPVQCV